MIVGTAQTQWDPCDEEASSTVGMQLTADSGRIAVRGEGSSTYGQEQGKPVRIRKAEVEVVHARCGMLMQGAGRD